MGDNDSFTGKPVSRRSAIKSLGAALAAGFIPPGIQGFGAKPHPRKPNIIVILADDHRWDAMSCMHHPFIQTPGMDRLAREGVHFVNTFCTNSLCSPSRASFLTGQYAHTHGVRNNLTVWRDSNTTLLELLKKQGYDTAFIGKWHMPGKLPRLRGVDRFITFTVNEGQGRYFDCPLIIDGVETPRPGKYITTDLTDYALEFMRRKRENPFCLYLSHKAVHHQFFPPPELDHLYDDVDLHLPQGSNSFIPLTRGNTWSGIFGTLEKNYRNYCEAVVAMDGQIGRLLSELDKRGMADDTIVVYAADNGIFWGEHQLVDKRWPYEEAIRIPFIIRYPAKIKNPGRRSAEMALNIDLAPTLLELAGAPVPADIEGRNLKPILDNQNVKLRDSFHYEYLKEFPYNTPELNGVRTERFMYVEYKGRRKPELFDILKDPGNRRNIINTAEGRQVLHGLKNLLDSYLKEVPHV